MRIVCSSQRYVYYVADCVCCICCDFKATTVSRWYAGKELKAPSMNLYEIALLSLPCLSASYFDSQVHRSGHTLESSSMTVGVISVDLIDGLRRRHRVASP